jgi:hypothetical protein
MAVVNSALIIEIIKYDHSGKGIVGTEKILRDLGQLIYSQFYQLTFY